MARRWVLCPMYMLDNDIYRSSLDPEDVKVQKHGSAAPSPPYVLERRVQYRYSKIERDYKNAVNHAVIIDVNMPGQSFCICNVASYAATLAVLNADPEIESILGRDDANLATDMKTFAPTTIEKDAIKARIAATGADISKLTDDSKLWEYMRQLIKTLWPESEGPAGTWCFDPEHPEEATLGVGP